MDLIELEVKVEGMVCDGCVGRVQTALEVSPPSTRTDQILIILDSNWHCLIHKAPPLAGVISNSHSSPQQAVR